MPEYQGEAWPWALGMCLGIPAAGWLLPELQVNLGLDTGPGEENLVGYIVPDLGVCASRDETI